MNKTTKAMERVGEEVMGEKTLKIPAVKGYSGAFALFLTVGMMMLVQGSLVGQTAGRQTESTKVDSFTVYQVVGTTKTAKLTVEVYRDFGLYSLKVVSHEAGVTFNRAQVRIQGQGNVWWKVNQDGTMETDVALNVAGDAGMVSNIKSGSGGEWDLSLRGKEILDYQEGLGVIGNGEQNLGSDTRVITLIGLKDALEKRLSADGTLTASLKLSQLNSGVERNVRAFSFKWKPEYFSGENACLYSGDEIPATPTYEAKALTALRFFWKAYSSRTAGETVLTNLRDIKNRQALAFALAHDFMSLYYGEVAGQTPLSVVARKTTEIIKYGYCLLPYKFDDKRISSLMYREDLPLYMREYLALTYNNQKSIASQYLEKAEKGGFVSTEYRMVDSLTGSVIAEVAKRYYAWGIDETTYGMNTLTVDAWLGARSGDGATNLRNFMPLSLATGMKSKACGAYHIAFTTPYKLIVPSFEDWNIGIPIPYQAGGIDTPRTYVYNRVKNKSETASGAPIYGIDEYGFIPGVLSMTDLDIDFAKDEDRAGELEKYSGFGVVSGSTILNKGKPTKYQRSSSESAIRKSRMSYADIERCSILIEDMKWARLGDIVLSTGAVSGKMDVGIIVRVPAAINEANRDEGFCVIHVSGERKGSVLLETLAEMRAAEGRGLQIRRLLHKSNVVNPGATTAMDWDVLDQNPSILDVRLVDTIGEMGNFSRWIPNTGEYYEFKVEARLLSQSGLTVDLKEYLKSEGARLRFGMVDRRTMPLADNDASNIIKNRGAGFQIVAKPKGKKFSDAPATGVLGEWHIPEELSTLGYVYQLNSTREGGIVISSPLVLDGKPNRATGYYKISYMSSGRGEFGIRPLVDDISPGDDIFLCLDIVKSDGTVLMSGEVPAEQYLAVYDKKMLWRANLYIDEGDGIEDWNNANPWNAPPAAVVGEALAAYPEWGKNAARTEWIWGLNEWNRYYDGDYIFTYMEDLPAASQNELTIGEEVVRGIIPGGQVVRRVHPFTWPDNNTNYDSRVAYDFWSHDSPFDYNKKMYFQKDYMGRFYGSNGVRPTQLDTNLPLLDPRWEITTAPAHTYSNYISVETRSQSFPNFVTPNQQEAISSENALKYPYIPSLSYTTDRASDSPSASGIDCVAFVRRAIGYDGENYAIPTETTFGSLNTAIWANESGSTETAWRIGAAAHSVYLWEITRRQPGIAPAINLDKIVPGDIIYYDGHIMMVQSVMPNDGGLVMLSNIRIIESTHGRYGQQGGDIFFTSNRRTLENLNANPVRKDWIIGRLKK